MPEIASVILPLKLPFVAIDFVIFFVPEFSCAFVWERKEKATTANIIGFMLRVYLNQCCKYRNFNNVAKNKTDKRDERLHLVIEGNTALLTSILNNVFKALFFVTLNKLKNMLTTIKGVYNNGSIILEETPEVNRPVEVLVTFIKPIAESTLYKIISWIADRKVIGNASSLDC